VTIGNTRVDKIGKYELIRQIGRGATATVYLGRDPFTQREVAVKVAFPGILKDSQRGRMYKHLFLNEAALVGKLQHPHIVQTYDAVVEEQLCYIVMEYVAGGTLENVCTPDKLLSVERVVEIIFKCTRALDFAVRASIIHRDIKPANILLVDPDAEKGDIKLSDFGAAIIGSPDRTLVLGVGSPAYMSPQQVKEMTLDHRTDIYSLGVVMYQLLTGQLPFQGRNSYEMIYQIVNTEPRKPSTLRCDLPPSLDAIVAKAMSKKINKRYRNWSEFGTDLAKAFGDRRINVPASKIADFEKFETLRAFPFFDDFTDAEIWEVVRVSEWIGVAAGENVIQDGKLGDCFYFLTAGELKVLKNGKMLDVLNVGECFGEMAVICKTLPKRVADIFALTDAKLVKISGDAFRTTSEGCRMHFYQSFFVVVSDRLSAANTRLVTF